MKAKIDKIFGLFAVAILMIAASPAQAQTDEGRLVIIGAPLSGDDGIDGFYHGVRALEQLVEQSPDLTDVLTVKHTPSVGRPKACQPTRPAWFSISTD